MGSLTTVALPYLASCLVGKVDMLAVKTNCKAMSSTIVRDVHMKRGFVKTGPYIFRDIFRMLYKK